VNVVAVLLSGIVMVPETLPPAPAVGLLTPPPPPAPRIVNVNDVTCAGTVSV
jgi:hypothetical protein